MLSVMDLGSNFTEWLDFTHVFLHYEILAHNSRECVPLPFTQFNFHILFLFCLQLIPHWHVPTKAQWLLGYLFDSKED